MTGYGRALAFLLLLLLPLSGVSRSDEGPGDLEGERARAVHVLNRIGYGPRPGDIDRVLEIGIYRYLVSQLHPEQIEDADCEEQLEKLDLFRESATELSARYRPDPEERKRYQENLARLAELKSLPERPEEEIATLTREVREYRAATDRNAPIRELSRARLVRALTSKRQLEQVMVDFWFNHFNVFARKGQAALLIPEFEEQVIRPLAFGRFEDLLRAVAKSPAMLFYLDNWMSAAPEGATVLDARGRPVEQRRGRRGLNENYARELLELHTVGVDGGYTQEDVIEVARCFTGWTLTDFRGRDAEITFRFAPLLHDAGAKRVMGREIPAGGGIEDGETVLTALANHPKTAVFVSEKLCRRFVSDDPPPELVKRLALTWLESRGDIRLVLHRLFTSDAFFSAGAARAKLKTPVEFAVSAIRAVGADTRVPPGLLAEIARLGEPLYHCEPPTGWPDTADDWSGSNAILARVDFAVRLTHGRIPGVKPEWSVVLGEGSPANLGHLTRRLEERCLGVPLSATSRRALARALAELPKSSGRGKSPRAIALLAAALLGSPDFQMQ